MEEDEDLELSLINLNINEIKEEIKNKKIEKEEYNNKIIIV